MIHVAQDAPFRDLSSTQTIHSVEPPAPRLLPSSLLDVAVHAPPLGVRAPAPSPTLTRAPQCVLHRQGRTTM